MKILFLNTNLGYGGASKMIAWVASRFAEKGHQVIFLTYRDGTVLQKMSPKVKHIHVNLEPISGKGKGLINSVIYLHRFIKKEQIALAIGFLYPSQIRLSLACIGTKTKLLFSHRGDPYQKHNGFYNKLSSQISDFFFRRADYFVFQTEGAKKYYPLSIQNRSVVISNPIEQLIRTKKRDSVSIEKRIVMVARLEIQQKRQDILIDAFKLIVTKYPDYCLEFWGDGPDEQVLKQLASGCQQIKFMGTSTNVADVIQNASMSVLSSDFEGIPNALLESMSLGVPCISTDCSPGGARMLIRDKENGLLIPRGDINALAVAMEYIICHPEESEMMAIKAMEVNNLYEENLIADKWMSFIKKISNEEIV